MTDQPVYHPHRILASMPPTGERFSVAIPIAEELVDTLDRDALIGLAKGQLAAALVEEFGDRIEVTITSPITSGVRWENSPAWEPEPSDVRFAERLTGPHPEAGPIYFDGTRNDEEDPSVD